MSNHPKSKRFNILTVPSARGPAARAEAAAKAAPTRDIRRGEVGKDLAEITRLENSGFVMSGSRNSRMNTLKEIETSEPVNIAEEKASKEDKLMEHFRQLLLSKRNS